MTTNMLAVKKKRVRRIALLLLLAASGSMAGAHEGHPSIPATGAAVHGDELLLSEEAVAASGVTTAKVTLADMPTYVWASGRITVPWRQHAYVTTLISGVVEDVFVDPGATLEAEQVLAHLSSLELENLQLDMLQADSDLSYYTGLYEQRQELSGQGSISGRKLMEAAQAREEAAARLQVALAKLKSLGYDGEALAQIRSTGRTTGQVQIRSPLAGSLVHADIRAGQSVDREEHLFHVVDNSVVWCVAEVLETDSASVEVGQPVTVDLAALGLDARHGRVDHIDVSVDTQKRVVHVVTELENQDQTLRPGMFARVAIQVSQSEQAVVCPRESLFQVGQDPHVLLLRGEGKFVRRKLELGRRGTQSVEVLNGLFPGDRVVAQGAHLLSSLFARAASPTEALGESEDASVSVAVSARLPSASLQARGVVELPPTGKFFATSRIAGRITEIFVEHSQRVERGDRLAELESMDLFDLQLELFQRNLERTWVERTVRRLEPVAQTGGVSKTQTRELKNRLRKLEHLIATLRRRLAISGLDEQRISRLLDADPSNSDLSSLVSRSITVRAPHAGKIAHFELVPGMTVNAHDHQLFEIHDLSQARVKAYLFEDQAAEVSAGQEAGVRFAADPGREIRGQVIRVAPTSTESRRVFPVWIELEKPLPSLREGMLARVSIRRDHRHGPEHPPPANIGPVAPVQGD